MKKDFAIVGVLTIALFFSQLIGMENKKEFDLEKLDQLFVRLNENGEIIDQLLWKVCFPSEKVVYKIDPRQYHKKILVVFAFRINIAQQDKVITLLKNVASKESKFYCLTILNQKQLAGEITKPYKNENLTYENMSLPEIYKLPKKANSKPDKVDKLLCQFMNKKADRWLYYRQQKENEKKREKQEMELNRDLKKWKYLKESQLLKGWEFILPTSGTGQNYKPFGQNKKQILQAT